jgi:hypothetical protein
MNRKWALEESDHRMSRFWLKGAVGYVFNALLGVAGYYLRRLMRAVDLGFAKAYFSSRFFGV